jgi:serine/threonine-protein kinase
MLCERGGMHDFAKVLDFGLVRGEEHRDDLSLTSVESLTGTPLYLSPEALEAPETVSARSDVYQLGAITYYLLTGDHVFTGETLVEVLSQHLNKEPVPPSEVLGREVSPSLERLILSCLAKDPMDRPASGSELLDAFELCEFEGHWTQEDARHWWADFDARGGRARIQARAAASHPTGLQIDFDQSARRTR